MTLMVTWNERCLKIFVPLSKRCWLGSHLPCARSSADQSSDIGFGLLSFCGTRVSIACEIFRSIHEHLCFFKCCLRSCGSCWQTWPIALFRRENCHSETAVSRLPKGKQHPPCNRLHRRPRHLRNPRHQQPHLSLVRNVLIPSEQA